jgi:elongator complex protein 1
MRNLKNIRYEQGKPPVQFHGKPLTAATWDLADPDDSVLCTFGPTPDNALIELVRVKTRKLSQYVPPQAHIFSADNL